MSRHSLFHCRTVRVRCLPPCVRPSGISVVVNCRIQMPPKLRRGPARRFYTPPNRKRAEESGWRPRRSDRGGRSGRGAPAGARQWGPSRPRPHHYHARDVLAVLHVGGSEGEIHFSGSWLGTGPVGAICGRARRPSGCGTLRGFVFSPLLLSVAITEEDHDVDVCA